MVIPVDPVPVSGRWPDEEDRHLRQETDAFARRVLPSLRTAKAAELTMRCPYDQQLYSDEDD